MDIILIPTFARPEYLQLCLEHLAAAGAVGKRIVVAHDRHTRDQSQHILNEVALTKQVISKFTDRLNIQFIERTPHNYVGNPSNFLELYKAAHSDETAEFVYLVEDDVLVAPDFFKWHMAAQARGDYFVTVGWHCIRNSEVRKSTDPTAYIESTRDFSSIGICWRREKLAPFVKHATPEYYQEMGNYLRRAFPGSPIPPGTWTEQAGVVTRLLHETKDRWVAWPALPRCAHVGISGYHRPGGHRFEGSLEQRVEGLRHAIATNRLNTLSRDPFDDVAGLNEIPDWKPEDMHVVQRFPYVHGKI